ncbi:hypothetical protein QYH69_15730 [Paraburkholderia sp. SARCC-3016]|uniref:hypothetical protein n=1 Tax=Paraburkholderia sp. SARCC-3016 TaxID=3058611 RepID=UPI002807962A|nr:hypothetical protein [Paraburkholderia sp. SARCC-3016]MDQ7978701.1 hypothetical protein [Paraburkholderia sp. SARCC-3016]
MQEPTTFQIVDGTGKVYHTGLTSAACDAFMSIMLADGKLPGLRSERMDTVLPVAVPVAVPHIVAISTPLPDIEPGKERDALRDANEARQDATKRLANVRYAVERAKAFHGARKAEHAALTVAHEAEIRESGANLAEAFKAGGTVAANRLIDRAALTDSETRLATAEAALAQLDAEQEAAEAADKAAETQQRLSVMAVKRAHAETLVERLEATKAEFMSLSAQLDAGRFSDVPATLRAEQAMQIEFSGMVPTDADIKRWRDFGAALAEDHEAAFGEA